MVLFGVCEFLGYESKESKSGNKYKQVKVLDKNFDSYQFYAGSDTVSDLTLPLNVIEKGDIIVVRYNYLYNSYDRAYRLNLLDILPFDEQIHSFMLPPMN